MKFWDFADILLTLFPKILNLITLKPYCLQNFLLLLMSLLITPIVKNSHVLGIIYLIVLKRRPRPNLKGFQYQIWTTVKRLKK